MISHLKRTSKFVLASFSGLLKVIIVNESAFAH